MTHGAFSVSVSEADLALNAVCSFGKEVERRHAAILADLNAHIHSAHIVGPGGTPEVDPSNSLSEQLWGEKHARRALEKEKDNLELEQVVMGEREQRMLAQVDMLCNAPAAVGDEYSAAAMRAEIRRLNHELLALRAGMRAMREMEAAETVQDIKAKILGPAHKILSQDGRGGENAASLVEREKQLHGIMEMPLYVIPGPHGRMNEGGSSVENQTELAQSGLERVASPRKHESRTAAKEVLATSAPDNVSKGWWAPKQSVVAVLLLDCDFGQVRGRIVFFY